MLKDRHFTLLAFCFELTLNSQRNYENSTEFTYLPLNLTIYVNHNIMIESRKLTFVPCINYSPFLRSPQSPTISLCSSGPEPGSCSIFSCVSSVAWDLWQFLIPSQFFLILELHRGCYFLMIRLAFSIFWQEHRQCIGSGSTWFHLSYHWWCS